MIDIGDMENVILKYVMYYRPVTPFFLHQPVDVAVVADFFPSIFFICSK